MEEERKGEIPRKEGKKGKFEVASWATNSTWLKLGTCDGSICRKDGDSPQGLNMAER